MSTRQKCTATAAAAAAGTSFMLLVVALWLLAGTSRGCSETLAIPAGADPVTITVPRQALQVIGQGLMELPYKTSSGILVELQKQLDAADRAAAEKAKTAAESKKDPKAGSQKAP